MCAHGGGDFREALRQNRGLNPSASSNQDVPGGSVQPAERLSRLLCESTAHNDALSCNQKALTSSSFVVVDRSLGKSSYYPPYQERAIRTH